MNNADFTVLSVAFAYYKEMTYEHFLNMKDRRHNGLTLILSGTIRMTYADGTSVIANAGSIILQRKGDSYRLDIIDKLGAEYIVISYCTEPENVISQLLPEHIFSGTHFRRYRDAFEEAARVYSSSGICQSALLRALVQEILCSIIRENHHGSLMKNADPAANAKYYMDEYFERNISAEDLAAVSGVCSSHLRMVFKKTYGESPNHYLNRVRIERAKEMIASGMFNLEEIAAACGFRNVYYFSRVFKEYTGTTPGRY